jgi:hypothetical protein
MKCVQKCGTSGFDRGWQCLAVVVAAVGGILLLLQVLRKRRAFWRSHEVVAD